MAPFYKFFGGTSPSVKKLLMWRQGDEDERWAEKAIESLIKKLKNKSESVALLDNILSTQNSESPCITIPRSLDGRLQILHRKGLPHVIYCRIFRWPDLQSQHEIRSVKNCQAPFNKNLPDVCVNPFHYERIEAMVPPPVLVPRSTDILGNITNTTNSMYRQPDFNRCMGQMVPVFQLQNTDSGYNNENIPKQAFTAVPFVVDQAWCAISYYELSNQVGEVYRPTTQSVIIDGYANPLVINGRISLGALSNVRRSQESDCVLGHIGSGILLFHNMGNVYIENNSTSSIFVQSSNINCIRGFNAKTVLRISAGLFFLDVGNSIQVFYANEFANLLGSRVSMGFYAVNELTKQCDIHISFIKGWGTGYSRQELTMCPCWLSIRLTNPLSWLDRVMVNMGSPKDPISSYT